MGLTRDDRGLARLGGGSERRSSRNEVVTRGPAFPSRQRSASEKPSIAAVQAQQIDDVRGLNQTHRTV